MKRRTFLKGAGVVTVLVVGGGVWRAYDQGVFSVGEGPAYEPWKRWRTDASEGPLALVRAAILAANPHNTQPWLFKLMETRIDLYADTGRNLGSLDPYLREMHIGLGCAVENMVPAAGGYGYKADVMLSQGTLGQVPEKLRPTLVARIELSKGKREQSNLYKAIPRRHTNRGPYDAYRALPPKLLAALHRMVEVDAEIKLFLYTAEADKARYSEAVIKATEAIIADPEMVRDSEKWFRHGWADVQKLRDGLTLDAAGMPSLITAIAKMIPPLSAETNHRYWLDATREVHMPTSPVFGLLAVRDLYSRVQNIRAGRMWQRMHLWATAHGIAMHPINQAVEMVDRQRALAEEPRAERVLAELTRDPAWKATFGFRMGYPKRKALASPRRPVDHVVV